ncbi:transposase [Streptomyces sp. NPDC004520]|uniref:transposase n=1 Tax=Streptomyces sp. NPDC004520 TaxID=3364702 RepID=UPI0036C79812
MRYAQGGGLTDAERAARERIRLQAVERFEGAEKNREIAAALRVSERWRRAWRERGGAGILSKGSPGRPRLSSVQIARPERELERGPLVHGWADQRWTPARVKTLIGRTPVVRVRGRGSGRVSMPGMTCYKPGERSRLIYAIREYRGRKGEPKAFGSRSLRDLLVRARIQLGGPIVLVWDNLRLHLTVGMRESIAADAAWLTVFQLPTHAPDLNP